MEARTMAAEELVNAERFTDGTPVYRVDAHTVVKTGDCVRLVEAAAMKLVREKTAIPVPEVYNAYTDPNSGHAMIVMEFIEGDRLADVWSKFSTDQKQQIIEQLCDFFSQLHNLKESFIGSVDGTACEDPLFDEIIGGYGPYHDEAAFNDGIMKSLKDTSTGGWVNTVCDMVGALKDYEIVLTHGDISPRNILVQGSKVVAILDWEMSGYYPEYWDYVKALFRPAWESDWIKDQAVNQILKPYLVELAIFLHISSIGGW